MSDPAKQAALEALRAVISRLFTIGWADMTQERRDQIRAELEVGHMELVAAMTPTELDVRLNVVASGERDEVFTAGANLPERAASVN